jgi:hypothetical protein
MIGGEKREMVGLKTIKAAYLISSLFLTLTGYSYSISFS